MPALLGAVVVVASVKSFAARIAASKITPTRHAMVVSLGKNVVKKNYCFAKYRAIISLVAAPHFTLT